MWQHDRVDYLPSVGDVDEETVGAFHGSEAPADPMNLLIQQYTAVQRTTAVRQQCECTEVLSRASNVRSDIMYFAPTPEGSPSATPAADMDFSTELSDAARPQAASDNTRRHSPSAMTTRLSPIQNLPRPTLPATQMANRLINIARIVHKAKKTNDMCCTNCGLLPTCPVTRSCGHTMCIECIGNLRQCPCGKDSTSQEHVKVNVVIKHCVEKAATKVSVPRSRANLQPVPGPSRGISAPTNRSPRRYPTRQMPIMLPRARHHHGVQLFKMGSYTEAACHFAIAAAAQNPKLRSSRVILAQILTILCRTHKPINIMRDISRLIRSQCSLSWIKERDMECVLCFETFVNPMTTPCGHVFCKTCLERTLDYDKRCPLCKNTLKDFNLREANSDLFIKAALVAINVMPLPKPIDPDLVPLVVCTVALPSVPCPVALNDRKYWFMIRKLLESGCRTFGMMAQVKDPRYRDYGTIVEVRDCLYLEDGRPILSTVGLSRFKVAERFTLYGSEYARIIPFSDIRVTNQEHVERIKSLGIGVTIKSLIWLHHIISQRRRKFMAQTFGEFTFGSENHWWEKEDGPNWLWWLVAVLPLRTDIKMLILSTDCLYKRLAAVERTLEAVGAYTVGSRTLSF